MQRKEIRPMRVHIQCDTCGRTLLPGEHAEQFIGNGVIKNVCELCVERAITAGWVRADGHVPPSRRERVRKRGSFFDKLRGRPPEIVDGEEVPVESEAAVEEPSSRRERSQPRRSNRERERDVDPIADMPYERHIHATPIASHQQVAHAAEIFNSSSHTASVASIARSLGGPEVVIVPNPEQTGLVDIVVAWELSWYRYEVDLGQEHPEVRLGAKGDDLEDLPASHREINATALTDGTIHLTDPAL